jgi:hypothetical protein
MHWSAAYRSSLPEEKIFCRFFWSVENQKPAQRNLARTYNEPAAYRELNFEIYIRERYLLYAWWTIIKSCGIGLQNFENFGH